MDVTKLTKKLRDALGWLLAAPNSHTAEASGSAGGVDLGFLAEGIQGVTKTLCSQEESAHAALSLLTDGGFCVELLRVLAVVLRAEQSGNDSTLRSQSFQQLADAVHGCLHSIYSGAAAAIWWTKNTKTLPPELSEARAFLRATLQSQALQAWSQSLAACASDVQRLLNQQPSVAQSFTPDARLALTQEDADPSTQAASPRNVAELSTDAVAQAATLLHDLVRLVQCVSGAEKAVDPAATSLVPEELVSQLHASSVLEHLARVFLLTAQLVQQPPTAAGGGDAGGSAGQDGAQPSGTAAADAVRLQALLRDCSIRISSIYTYLHKDFPPSAGLTSVLSGPCLRHAVVSAGVAALSVLDGGTVYGLPPDLVASLRVLAVGLAKGTHDEAEELIFPFGPDASFGDGLLLGTMLRSLLAAPRRPPLGAGPAWALLRRTGAAVKSSTLAWAALGGGEGQQGSAGQAREAPPEASGDSQEAGRGANRPPSAAPHRVPVMARNGLVVAAIDSLALWDDLLGSLQRGSPAWMEAAVERWRLAVTAVKAATLGARVLSIRRLTMRLIVAVTQMDESGGSLPADPPPDIAAAVAAGLVPCLEGLVRRSLQQPDRKAAWVLANLRNALRDAANWSYLPWLLAYCDPGQAASFVLSLKKGLLHCEQRLTRVLVEAFGGSSTGSGAAGGSAEIDASSISGMLSLLDWCMVLVTEACDFLSGSPQVGRPSAASQRLRSLLTAAVCELLPPMSRIVRHVAQQLIERGAIAGRKGAADGSRGSGSSAAAGSGSVNSGRDVVGLAAIASGYASPSASRANDTDTGSSGTKAAVEMLDVMLFSLTSWLPSLASDLSPAPGRNCQFPEALTGDRLRTAKRLVTACAVASAAAAADPAGSTARREGWRRFLVEEVGAVEVVGAALRLVRLPALQRHWQEWRGGGGAARWNCIAGAVAPVAAACSAERHAVLHAYLRPESASPESGCGAAARHQLRPAGPRARRNRVQAQAFEGDMSIDGVNFGRVTFTMQVAGRSTPVEDMFDPASQRCLAFWPPNDLAWLESQLNELGLYDAATRVTYAMADQLALAYMGSAPAPKQVELLPRDKAAGLAVLPPDVARRQLLGSTSCCSNPACTNLSGDSESGLPLLPCTRGCGTARYCCSKCEAAHWQAGHEAACGEAREADGKAE